MQGFSPRCWREAVGERGKVVTVDTSRGASRSARAALADLGWVSVVTDSVRRALAAQPERADVAVLDPPRSGAGREVIDLLAAAEVPRDRSTSVARRRHSPAMSGCTSATATRWRICGCSTRSR